MGTSFEDILNRMRNAPHVGVSPVTNPKLPTKVERDVEAAKVRQKAMPNFHFGTGTQLERLLEHMKNAPHSTPKYADPQFANANTSNGQSLSKSEIVAIENEFDAFINLLETEV